MMSDPEDPVGRLWAAYKESGSIADRNKLVEHYYSLVQTVARRLVQSLPRSVDREDLTSYGVFALIDAIDKFDPARGLKFETYALARLKGGIISELRKVGVLPRSVMVRVGTVRKTHSRLENELGRNPTPAEIAEFMEVPVEQVLDALAADATLTSLDAEISGEGSDQAPATLADQVTGDDTDPAANSAVIVDLQAALARAIRELPERERTFLALRYREKLTTEDIASTLAIAVGRVSQVHTGALLALRDLFAGPILAPHLDRV